MLPHSALNFDIPIFLFSSPGSHWCARGYLASRSEKANLACSPQHAQVYPSTSSTFSTPWCNKTTCSLSGQMCRLARMQQRASSNLRSVTVLPTNLRSITVLQSTGDGIIRSLRVWNAAPQGGRTRTVTSSSVADPTKTLAWLVSRRLRIQRPPARSRVEGRD